MNTEKSNDDAKKLINNYADSPHNYSNQRPITKNEGISKDSNKRPKTKNESIIKEKDNQPVQKVIDPNTKIN